MFALFSPDIKKLRDKKKYKKLIELLLHNKKDLIRSEAAWALGDIGNNEAIDSLILALKDKNNKVRINACASLCLFYEDAKIDRAIEPLMGLLHNDNTLDWNIIITLANIANRHTKHKEYILDFLITNILRISEKIFQRDILSILRKVGHLKRDEKIALCHKLEHQTKIDVFGVIKPELDYNDWQLYAKMNTEFCARCHIVYEIKNIDYSWFPSKKWTNRWMQENPNAPDGELGKALEAYRETDGPEIDDFEKYVRLKYPDLKSDAIGIIESVFADGEKKKQDEKARKLFNLNQEENGLFTGIIAFTELPQNNPDFIRFR